MVRFGWEDSNQRNDPSRWNGGFAKQRREIIGAITQGFETSAAVRANASCDSLRMVISSHLIWKISKELRHGYPEK